MSMKIRLVQGDALLIIDPQNDFLPGGPMAVPFGHEIIPLLNRYIILFRRLTLPVLVTREWHPANHCSFDTRQGLWPVHCVQHSRGAAFADNLKLPPGTHVVSRAEAPEQDVYSGFNDTDLHSLLQAEGVRRLFIAGLALEYGLFYTLRDALERGYMTLLLSDAVRARELHPGDGDRTLEGLSRQGVSLLQLDDLSV